MYLLRVEKVEKKKGEYTESWAHRGSVSDAPLSSALDENFLHASIFDVFALVGSVQRIGDRCAGDWLR